MVTVSQSRRLLLVVLGAVLFCGWQVPSARADSTWSTWQSFGNGVSVSFKQVDRAIWTWKFRNDDEFRTITSMSFNVSDDSGAHGDSLPGILRPGNVFGGWAAFTADATVPERIVIRITHIEWK
jgi:hypothetical protein